MILENSLKVIINVDGGSRGNPGPAACGIVIRHAASHEILYRAGLFLGRATNNVAEYQGLLGGLRQGAKLGATEVMVNSDSELLVRQMNGEYRVKNATLAKLCLEAHDLLSKFHKYKIVHVPREQNALADTMANKAMDLGRDFERSSPDAPASADDLPDRPPGGAGAREVLCLQYEIAWEDPPANYAKVSGMLAGAAVAAGSLVVLPEMFSTGFSMNAPAIAQGGAGKDEEFLASAARKHNAWIVGGVVAAGDGGKGLNQAVAFDPSGREVARYTKIHPFTFGREHEHYQGGDTPVVFDWAGAAVAPVICYDLRFPELFRLAVLEGADMFVVLANWPAAREHHWTSLLPARAIENLAYVAAVNTCGQNLHNLCSGKSAIIDPGGRNIAQAGNSECVIRANLDIPQMRKYRRAFPALKDIRLIGKDGPSGL